MNSHEKQYIEKLKQGNPLEHQLSEYEKRLDRSSPLEGGNTREVYLHFAEARLRQFAPYQDSRGAIIDPMDGNEREYATASYTMTGAVLLSANRCIDLKESVLLAMDWACYCLGANQVPDGHADFVTHMLVQAYRLLLDITEPDRVMNWADNLRKVDPEETYTQVERNLPLKQTRNWTTYAMHGEMLRFNEGFTNSIQFIDKYLAAQLTRFTTEGLYRDPNLPAAYDLAARDQLSAMLAEGYSGLQAEFLSELLDRGVQNMLFTQSVTGEISFGGRSNQVIWNELTFALLCEREACRRMRSGQRRWAGVFKRAAALAVQSLDRWMNDPEEFRLFKNRYPASSRAGWEFYAYYSTYSLYAAKIASACYLIADDEILQYPAPCELGAHAVFIRSFHRIYVSSGSECGGYNLGFDTFAQQGQDASGAVRLHRAGVPGETALSMGIPGFTDDIPWQFYRARSLVPSPKQAVSISPVWQDGFGIWHRFANYGRRRHEIFHELNSEGQPVHGELPVWNTSLEVLGSDENEFRFRITHEAVEGRTSRTEGDSKTAGANVIETQRKSLSDRLPLPGNGGCSSIVETYSISAAGIDILWRMEAAQGADIAAVGVCVPLLKTNGIDEAEFQMSQQQVKVVYCGHVYEIHSLSNDVEVHRFNTLMPNRNGHYFLCQWIKRKHREISLHLSLQ